MTEFKPQVMNKHHKAVDGVYVGRPTVFGNPYSHSEGTLAKYKVATRKEAIEKYREYAEERMESDPEFKASVEALRGRNLVCWCAPRPCHADVLLELANAEVKP